MKTSCAIICKASPGGLRDGIKIWKLRVFLGIPCKAYTVSALKIYISNVLFLRKGFIQQNKNIRLWRLLE